MSYPPPPPPPPGGPYGSGPGGYGPGGYGAGGYGGYQAPIEHPRGTTILVLGILGLVCCGPLGTAAWIMGNSALREIDSAGQAYSNRGQINAGRICGIIATILMIIGIVGYAVLIAVAVSTGSSSNSF